MLARMEMELGLEEALSYQMSSLFHGVLMELLSDEYADKLHQSQLHPYSQHLEWRDKKWYWVVNCFNEEAVSNIMTGALMNLDDFEIKKRNLNVKICQKNYETISHKDFLNFFYDEEEVRYIQVQFLTSTAFKQRGQYVFYPDLRCIYQSLMNKYEYASRDSMMTDEETLNELCEHSQIVSYELKTVPFSLEKVKIPAFVGKITIKMQGTKTMARFARFLFEFGTYSGVGIKTAIGMGALKVIRNGGRNSDRRSC